MSNHLEKGMLGVNKTKRVFATGCLLAAGAIGLAASPESQAAYVYTLDNVTLSDGTSATGFFSIGEAYGYLEDWNITTTNGVFAGNNYSPTINGFNLSDKIVAFVNDSPAYDGYLYLTFANSLWAESAFVPPVTNALVAGYSASFECATYGNGDWSCPGAHRDVTSGAVTNGAVTSVPEPGTLALFGLGLAGLGFVRRKRAA